MNVNQLKHDAMIQKWQNIIADCRSSEMPVSRWCKSNKISTSTYYKWEKVVLEQSCKSTSMAPQFVEMPAVILPDEDKVADVGDKKIACITVNGMKLEIFDSMPLDMIQTILRVMKC